MNIQASASLLNHTHVSSSSAGEEPLLENLLLVLTIESGGDNSLCFSGSRIRLSCGLNGTTHYLDLITGLLADYRTGPSFSLFVVTETVMEDSVYQFERYRPENQSTGPGAR